MRGEAQDSTSGLAGGRRRLLLPLATALAFSLFAALFCVLALMDLGRTERLLLTVLHNRAAAMVHAFEKASQEKYRRLLWGGGEDPSREAQASAAGRRSCRCRKLWPAPCWTWPAIWTLRTRKMTSRRRSSRGSP